MPCRAISVRALAMRCSRSAVVIAGGIVIAGSSAAACAERRSSGSVIAAAAAPLPARKLRRLVCMMIIEAPFCRARGQFLHKLGGDNGGRAIHVARRIIFDDRGADARGSDPMT